MLAINVSIPNRMAARPCAVWTMATPHQGSDFQNILSLSYDEFKTMIWVTNILVWSYDFADFQKTAKHIHLPFRLWTRVGRRIDKFNRICQVAPMCPYGRTRCRHLSNDIEPSVYGSDAPYGKLLWPLVIFGHADLHSCTDSQALQAKYCIVSIPHNTAIELFIILINSVISYCNLLYFNVCRFRRFKLSVYGKCFSSITSLLARFCTFCMSSVSPILYGH